MSFCSYPIIMRTQPATMNKAIFRCLISIGIGLSLSTASLGVAEAIPSDPRNRSVNREKSPPKRTPMSDEDVLNPKKLVFDLVVPYTDSFDGTERGKVFISKRAAVGSADRKYGGYFGEKGSSTYMSRCLLFCPPGTRELDATYLYVFEVKGECQIGARAIGWKERDEDYDGGNKYVTTISYRGTPENINQIGINDQVVSMDPKVFSQIEAPQGTNYKYFPRNKGMLLGLKTTTESSSDLSSGFITSLHYFPAKALIKAVTPYTESVSITFPKWVPSTHTIEGEQLTELKSLLSNCDDA